MLRDRRLARADTRLDFRDRQLAVQKSAKHLQTVAMRQRFQEVRRLRRRIGPFAGEGGKELDIRCGLHVHGTASVCDSGLYMVTHMKYSTSLIFSLQPC